MAAAYQHRQPYPALVFAKLKELAQPGPVLEIGAGTGDATLELAWRFDRVDAVEPSAEMLRVAARRTGRNIRWIQSTFEEAELEPPYGLAVAAESIHWTDWQTTFPRIAEVLAPDALLALLYRVETPPPWASGLGALIGQYSTNREFAQIDIVEELRERRLFRVKGSLSTLREARLQPVDDYIESFHSRNGLSRTRMASDDATAFDNGVRELVKPHLKDGLVPLTGFAQLTWGVPMP